MCYQKSLITFTKKQLDYYLAGLIEGDGSFYSNILRIYFYKKDRPIEKLKMLFV